MIDNDYVFEVNIEFDINEFELIINNLKLSGLRAHQQKAEDYEYTNQVYQKHHKVLGNIWNYYLLKPNTGFPIHIDARRTAALNIPIYGSTGSVTKFYEMPDEELIYNDRLIAYQFQNNVEEKFEFTLTKPSVIRVNVPHSVMAGNEHRLIISWGLNTDLPNAKQYFNEYALNC